MPPEENNNFELFMMNENGEPVKIVGFSEMQKCEVKCDPSIDLKGLYEAKYEGTFELTPESAAQMAEWQKQLDAEIIENLHQQINRVDAVIAGLKYCNHDDTDRLLTDAIAIAEAYKTVIEKGLNMMEEKNDWK